MMIDLTGYNFRFGFLNIALEQEGSFTEYPYNKALSTDFLHKSGSILRDQTDRSHEPGFVVCNAGIYNILLSQ